MSRYSDESDSDSAHESGKINLIFDLDNTLISSISMKELKQKKLKNIDSSSLHYDLMDGYYRVYSRPGLQKFLDYAFKHFNVSIWTAASRDYATFIIDNIILNPTSASGGKSRKRNSRRLKMFFYDANCEQCQSIYENDSPKDLRYIYNFPEFYSCNSVIMDDLKEVREANPNNVIVADYFDAKDYNKAEKDDFLVRAKVQLEKLRKQYKKSKCKEHH